MFQFQSSRNQMTFLSSNLQTLADHELGGAIDVETAAHRIAQTGPQGLFLIDGFALDHAVPGPTEDNGGSSPPQPDDPTPPSN